MFSLGIKMEATTTTTTTTIENCVKRWVCVKWDVYKEENGLFVRICSGPDHLGNIKDFAIIRCIDEYGGVSDYAIMTLDSIISIEIDESLEKYFLESRGKDRERLLSWFEGGPDSDYLQLLYLERKIKSIKM